MHFDFGYIETQKHRDQREKLNVYKLIFTQTQNLHSFNSKVYKKDQRNIFEIHVMSKISFDSFLKFC